MDELKLRFLNLERTSVTLVWPTRTGMSEDEWAQHCQRKDDVRKNKENYKKYPYLQLVCTMDLQAVLICPRMQASALFPKEVCST